MNITASRLRIKFFVFFGLSVTALFTLIAMTTVLQLRQSVVVATRIAGTPILKRAAALIDGDKYEQLAQTLDSSDPFYLETQGKFRALRMETQAVFLYTMARYEGNVHRFIFDAEYPGSDQFSHLGTKEDVSDYEDAYFLAYETKTPQFSSLTAQETWGRLISGYEAILNSKGDIVGIIGVDFSGEDFYQTIMLSVRQQVVFAVLFIIIGLSFYFFFLKDLSRQNEELYRVCLRAEAASLSKSDFLSRMSHEIRTPMNAIIGMSELAQRDYGKPQGLEFITDINQAGTNLLAIINDILDFSKIESGRMEIANERYETAALLNGVLSILYARLKGKNMRVDLLIDESIPSVMIGDAVRIRQVLLNLLNNAVKYTEKGFISFSAQWRRESVEAATLTFTVEDSGIGIRAEDMEKLFEAFSRLEMKRNTSIEGTGLGLSISRDLCRAMGGSITAASVYGKGSTFTVTLPQKIADDSPMGALVKNTRHRGEINNTRFSAPEFRVLIVDDVISNLKVAKGLLASYEIKADTCLSGNEAVSLLRENDYDLVLMDHMMPGMDGIETLNAIRALGGNNEKLPVVALTANAVLGMKEMFLQNGFDDFLSKPIEMSDLNKLLERWVPEKRKGTPMNKPTYSIKRNGRDLIITLSFGRGKNNPTTQFEVEGLDISRGMALSGGLEKDYREILDTYCQDVVTRLEFLDYQYAEENLKNFTTQVHALRSASATIGAWSLTDEAMTMEDAGKRGDMEYIRAHVDAFRENITNLAGRIGAALAKPGVK